MGGDTELLLRGGRAAHRGVRRRGRGGVADQGRAQVVVVGGRRQRKVGVGRDGRGGVGPVEQVRERCHVVVGGRRAARRGRR